MNRWLLMLVSLFFVTTASADTSTARSKKLIADAQRGMAELNAAQFDKLEARFDAKMAAALPLDKLTATWKGIVSQLGAYKSCDAPTTAEENGFVVVVVPCDFANTPITARFIYDNDDKLAGLFFKPRAAATYVPPGYVDEKSFVESDVTLGSGASSLAAKLTLPNGASNVPGVVLVQGSGPHDADETIGPNRVFRDLAWGLSSHGIGVLRYEKRTEAHPDAFKGDFTVDDETVNDAVAALKLLAATHGVDASRVFVAGHSLGAMMAPRIAQRDPPLHGVILLAPPARPLEDIVVDQQHFIAGDASDAERKAFVADIEHKRDIVKQLKPGVKPAAPLLLDLPAVYWLDLNAYDPVAVAAASDKPMLVVQGARDWQVTAPDYARWKALCAKDSRVRCELYPALNHLLIAGAGKPGMAEYQKLGHVDAKVVDDIVAFIRTAKATG
jgi:dienelactone hydrolase